jgi:hypothetical protein
MYWHDIQVQVQVSNNIDGHGLCTHLEAMPIHAHPKPMGMGMDMDTQCTVLVWSELGTSPAFSTNESVWSVMVTGSQSHVWSGPKSYDVITKTALLLVTILIEWESRLLLCTTMAHMGKNNPIVYEPFPTNFTSSSKITTLYSVS